MPPFVHLHVHSSYSPGWGIHDPETLCAAAGAMGLDRMALTDRNGLYGIPHFLRLAREAGIKPIIGAEAVDNGRRAILLAKDEAGYANLCRLLSDLHCRGDFDISRSLLDHRQGLVVLSDDGALLSRLKRQDPGDLYVEMSPGHSMHNALALSRRLKLPPVATSRAVLIGNGDYHLHRVLRAIDMNTKLDRLSSTDTAAESDSLLSPGSLVEHFPHCPEAMENSVRVAELCRTDWDFSRLVFPGYRGMSDDEAYQDLEDRARKGAQWRYGKIDGKVKARLLKELDLIRKKGFAHYFLVVEELAKRSPRTCGRGSAAASMVAYCMGITHVDPLKYNLFFERFLNPGRVDPPDIDIDFPWDERDDVLDYAFARYGTRRAAMVANQVSFRARAALREVAKVYGLTDGEIKDMTRRMSGYWKPDKAAAAVATHPRFAGEKLNEDWKMILETAQRLDGQMRHLSLHCGGLVIVPDEIRRYVPVQVSAKGMPVIQWEKDQTEAAGLVKIDILGNRSLAVIRDALAAVQKNTGRAIDYAQWQPLEDERTRALIRSGDTMGCFYVESPATRQLLRRMWGDNAHPVTLECDLFEHLVMASSIIRPAANAFILEFVDRMRGKPWRSLHPLLDAVLDETYGIAIYQEQITQMVMALAGFSAFDGDQLRKVITKKHQSKRVEDYRQMFLTGGVEKGISNGILEKCWNQILSFSGYSFCKPHSASYALVSCKSAYLKSNYPAEFMAAVVSNQGGFYSAFAYLSEARRIGITVLPPHINASDYHYTGQKARIRMGLMQIEGLTRKAVDSLLKEKRENGPYGDFADFLHRTQIDPSDLKLLVKAGCFDDLDGMDRRPALIWEILGRNGSRGQRSEKGQIGFVFEQSGHGLPEPEPYDEKMVLRQEMETLGMLVSRHPLDLHRDQLAGTRYVPAANIGTRVGRSVTMIGWWVTGKPVRTKHGEPMEFVTFEDTTAIFDTTFFPKAYARFCRKMVRHRPYILKGKVEEEFGVATLNVQWIGFLDENSRKYQVES